MKFTIGIKIFVGYAVAFLAIAVLSGQAYLSLKHLEENFHEAQLEREFIDQLNAFHDFILDGQDGQQEFLITGNRATLTKLDAAIGQLDTRVKQLREAPAAIGRDAEITKIGTLAKTALNQLKVQEEERGSATLAASVAASGAGACRPAPGSRAAGPSLGQLVPPLVTYALRWPWFGGLPATRLYISLPLRRHQVTLSGAAGMTTLPRAPHP